jgi:uncharacterized protein YjiS (DUF1127 family)
MGKTMCASDDRNLDYRNLTPEQWEQAKRRIMRCAQAARTRALRELPGAGLRAMRAAVGGGYDLVRALAAVLTARAQRWWAGYVARRARRAAVRELAALDDRTLKDIGITRSEIASVVFGREVPCPSAKDIAPARCRKPGARAGTGIDRSPRPLIEKNAA